jgi:hypothetical protein
MRSGWHIECNTSSLTPSPPTTIWNANSSGAGRDFSSRFSTSWRIPQCDIYHRLWQEVILSEVLMEIVLTWTIWSYLSLIFLLHLPSLPSAPISMHLVVDLVLPVAELHFLHLTMPISEGGMREFHQPHSPPKPTPRMYLIRMIVSSTQWALPVRRVRTWFQLPILALWLFSVSQR